MLIAPACPAAAATGNGRLGHPVEQHVATIGQRPTHCTQRRQQRVDARVPWQARQPVVDGLLANACRGPLSLPPPWRVGSVPLRRRRAGPHIPPGLLPALRFVLQVRRCRRSSTRRRVAGTLATHRRRRAPPPPGSRERARGTQHAHSTG
eukprot:scaffold36304_cov121-Isochrysis_galbana.AAC.10